MFTLPLPLGPETWSVSDLNRYVRQALETDIRLQDVRVQGEISGFKAYPSGHWYFTLKDGSAQISCVMWRQRTARMRFTPGEGESVELSGKVTLYEQRGQYQFDVAVLEPLGQGALFADFTRLKARLDAEGLFDPARKRALPATIRRIAIITSPAGAALQDMLTVLRRRNPLAEVGIAPTPVQGPEAVPGLVAALNHFGRLPAAEQPDVIVIARGGGALEDLAAFNDEKVARAIDALRALPAPIVSGVGHETDFTIADFVADVRAPTPSAAAELCSPVTLGDHRQAIDDLAQRVADAILTQLDRSQAALTTARLALRSFSPATRLAGSRATLRQAEARLQTALRHRLALTRGNLLRRREALIAYNPQAVLDRGYAIVRQADGRIVTSAAAVQTREVLTIRVRDGEFEAERRDG
jgi:exodeoxyribonuclease VII large subunit